MNFEKEETPKTIQFNQLADELNELQQAAIKRLKIDADIITYVNWIIQDLRRGDLQTAKINYEQQRDKYNDKPEIRKFLEDNGIVEKGINWDAWKNSDSYEEYQEKNNQI